MSGRGRLAAVIAAGAVAAALLGAFVMLRSGDTAVVALADAAERIDGESMRVRVNLGMTDASGQYAISGEGVVAADNSRGVLDMKVIYNDERPVDMRLLNIGDEFWYRSRQFRRVLPRGKEWVHSVDRTVPPSTLTPSEWTAFLAEADDVEELGEERVLGRPATHYQGMVDLEELADEIGGESKERFEALLEEQDVPDGARIGLPIEAWISRDGLPIRMRLNVSGGKESMDMTTDVLEYGVPVEVEPPPPSRTIEEAEFDRLTGG